MHGRLRGQTFDASHGHFWQRGRWAGAQRLGCGKARAGQQHPGAQPLQQVLDGDKAAGARGPPQRHASRQQGLLDQAKVDLDARGNVFADVFSYRTSDPKIYACGDMRRGQSLVVWAIREGRQAARAVDEMLMGVSELPR